MDYAVLPMMRRAGGCHGRHRHLSQPCRIAQKAATAIPLQREDFIDKTTPPIACSISDISESGARLALPETFMLLLTANGGARRHCRVVWREGLMIGVEFPEHRS
jgi:PilZ domain-containing protein